LLGAATFRINMCASTPITQRDQNSDETAYCIDHLDFLPHSWQLYNAIIISYLTAES